jgi:hypothetical protein
MGLGLAYSLGFAAMHAAKLAAEKQEQALVEQPPQKDEFPVPQRLSLKLESKDYHPCYVRVGVLLDGVERKDVASYDVALGQLVTLKHGVMNGVVTPFWRYPETRQQRRARESWEAKRK